MTEAERACKDVLAPDQLNDYKQFHKTVTNDLNSFTSFFNGLMSKLDQVQR